MTEDEIGAGCGCEPLRLERGAGFLRTKRTNRLASAKLSQKVDSATPTPIIKDSSLRERLRIYICRAGREAGRSLTESIFPGGAGYRGFSSYVQRFEIFEMPLLGYLGYLPFGLQCCVVADLAARLSGASEIAWMPSKRIKCR